MQRLRRGAPDAFVNGDSRVRRLFQNYRQVEEDYYRSTGIFPIMHAVAVRRDVLHNHPWVPRNLFKAFDEARRRSVARALDSTRSLFPMPWGNEHAEGGMQILGKDYFPLRHRGKPHHSGGISALCLVSRAFASGCSMSKNCSRRSFTALSV